MSASELRCAGCRHFNRDAAELEALLPGLRTLSSAYAAVRSEDGLCSLHDRYVAAYSHCAAHQPPDSQSPKLRWHSSGSSALI
jgi:hypothetical protein